MLEGFTVSPWLLTIALAISLIAWWSHQDIAKFKTEVFRDNARRWRNRAVVASMFMWASFIVSGF